MSSSNIIAWEIKFLWASESRRVCSLCLLHLVWTSTSRKICFLDSVLTALSLNASEASEIRTSHFLTSSVLNSLYCSDFLCHNFSSSEISLWHLASKLYVTVEPLYLWICFLNCDNPVFYYVWIIELQGQHHSFLTLSY